jgi:hypothetical protein
MTQRTTLFLCPAEGCDKKFKTTYGRTQHICAKHPNFGINEPDDMNSFGGHQQPGTNSSHTTGSQFDQSDEHMVIDSDPPGPPIVSDDFLHPPMSYSRFSTRSPPLFDDMLPRPFSTFHSPVHPHDGSSESSDADAIDIESTHHSRATSPCLDSSPADTADVSATLPQCAFTDYHPILNGKFIHSFNQIHCTD